MSTMMRRDAWRAINVIADLCAAAGGGEADYPTVQHVLKRNVDGGALIWLYESMGYAAAVNGHDGVGMERTVKHGQADGGRHDPTIVKACLTPAGVHWWHHDPHQAILRIVRGGGGRMRLSEPALLLDGGVDEFEGLLEAGLIQVVHTPTGQTPPTSLTYLAQLIGRDVGGLYTVGLTKLGRNVSGLT